MSHQSARTDNVMEFDVTASVTGQNDQTAHKDLGQRSRCPTMQWLVAHLVSLAGVVAVIGMLGINESAHALKSDRNQPALINADEIEIDFKTGDRIYIGNVTIVQGSIRLNADKLVARFDGSKLQKATAYGKPAVFKQRPDDADGDVVGTGNTMVIDEVKQLITLSDNASLTQAGGATIASDNIVYDMTTEKLKATGGTTTKKPADKSSKVEPVTEQPAKQTATATAPAKAEPATADKAEDNAAKLAKVAEQAAQAQKPVVADPNQPSITSKSGRMRIVIPPRKKPQS